MVTILSTLETKLPPCPCCGSKSDMLKFEDVSYGVPCGKTYKVSCTKCGMRTCKMASSTSAKKCWSRRNGQRNK